MRMLSRLLFLLLIIGPLALLGLAWFALEPTPDVTPGAALSHKDIARAEKILRTNDPRRHPPGTTGSATLSADDLNLAVGYLFKRTFGADAQIKLTVDQIQLLFTRQLPGIPLHRYINIKLEIVVNEQQPMLQSLRVGRLDIPRPIARQAATLLVNQLSRRGQLEQALNSIRDLQITENQLQLSYRWNPALIDDARETLLNDLDRNAIAFYHDQIVALQRQGIGKGGSLSVLLQPLFAAAQRRSETGDAVTENTALLSVLGSWAGRRGLHRLVPGDIARPDRFRLRLRNRIDFAQHFLVSAALAARGDSLLSNAVGVFKEIVDTDKGSGFSFTDLAADLSGSRFGELATGNQAAARKIQRILASSVSDADLLPKIDDLPEFLNTTQFEQRFEHVGSPAYEAVIDDIMARIAALPLYEMQ